MRTFKATLLALSIFTIPTFALADDKPLDLPTDAEIEVIIEKLPDLNALMDGFIAVTQDEELKTSLKDASEKLSSSLEKIKDIETRENGTPDLNQLMATMLRTLSDEDVMGEMVGVIQELQETVEENFDEEMLKPKP